MNFLRASIRQVMGCIILVTALAAQSQEFPSKPIRIISPFSAGSSTDLIARVIGQKITENTGQQVIVDTRPGANGIIGVDLAAKAAPDGYTIVLASNGTHGINVSLFNKLPYDPVKDFAPVTQVGHVAYLLLTSNSAPFNSLQDLVAAAKANPGRHTLGSAASVAQLTGELLKVTAGMNVSAVPYKTFAAAVTDLVNKQLDVHFEPIPSGLPLVKAGRLKALAVTSASRSSLAPEVPTIAEAGYPGFESGAWVAFFAPAGTPKEVVVRLHAEIARALQSPDVREKLAQSGLEVVSSSPEQLAELVKTEIAKWAKLFKAANLPRQN
jgi:tripartite-type tricarboxylate transporter receptor subunit TctC